MITWIQKYFQHHFRSIFAILLAGTIVSFIFTIGASGGIGHGERNAIERPFFGANLASAADAQRINNDAQLSVYISYGMPNADGEQLQQYALQRFASISLADQLHIPAPSAEQLKAHVRTLRVFQGKDGEFDPQAYAKFRDTLKGNPRLREGEVFRVMADDYRADLVQKLFSGPGYVVNADVRKQLARADTQWGICVASIPVDSFKPSINPSEAELTKFYADNKFRYEVAPRFSGSYIAFNATNYTAKVTPSDDDLRAYFKANQAKFVPAPKDPKAPTAEELVSFEQAKPRVEATYKLERARRLALRDAADLSVFLDDKKADSKTLAKLVADRGLSLVPVKPFARNEPSAELGSSSELTNEAFKLNANRLFSDAIAVPTGAVILVWDATIPARQPELAEVRAKVAADYVASETRSRFVEMGKTLRSSIETSLKACANFSPAADKAAATAGVKIEYRTPPAFTLRQPPRDLPYAVMGTLESLEKGHVSEMTIADEKGILVFAAEKAAPASDDNAPAFVEARTQLARMSGNMTGGAIMTELVERELRSSTPATP